MWSLRFVGSLYLISGGWCAFNPADSANYLGFMLVDQGVSEFVSVYGGLQLGLGAAMMLSTLKDEFIPGALCFAFITSLGLLTTRIMALIGYGANTDLYIMAALELFIVVILALPLYHVVKHKP